MFKSPNGTLLGRLLYNANFRNLDLCIKYTFSQKQSVLTEHIFVLGVLNIIQCW